MKIAKTMHESKPVAEALDYEKVVVAQSNGVITVAYLHSDKILSIQLKGEAVQLAVHDQRVYVSTKPFEIKVAKGEEESDEVLANNLLACRKVGVTLWQIDIQEDSLTIKSRFDNVGGFAIHENKLYACNSISFGFYVLSVDLTEIERVDVQHEPSIRSPWFSIIKIIDDILFLIQEYDCINYFKLGKNIEEKGIIEPESRHLTHFVSINAAPVRILKIGEHIVCMLESGDPVVITFVDEKPIVAVDPKIILPLLYNGGSGVLYRVKEATDQYVLAMDRFRIIVTDVKMDTVLHGFCFDEIDEGLNFARITGFGKYAVCYAWTYSDKCPLIVVDLTNPQEPVIVKIVDCGATSGAIKVDIDE